MYVIYDLSGDLRQGAHPQRKSIVKLSALLLSLPTHLGKSWPALIGEKEERLKHPIVLGLVYNNHCVVGGPRARYLITC